MKKWHRKFERGIFLVLLFLLPTQLAYHFWPQWAFVFGIRIDYLAPTVYLSDLLVSMLLFLNLQIFRKYKNFLLALLFFASFNTAVSVYPFASLVKWLKVLEMVSFSLYIANQTVLKSAEVVKTLFYSGSFFSFIGVLQFLVGSTLGGPFYLFGERSFNLSTPGIALFSISGRQFLRAYSTFPHPNSLAGFLGIVIILSTSLPRNAKIFLGGFVALSLGFLLSYSLSAIFSLIAIYGLFLLSKKKKVFKRLNLLILSLVTLSSLLLPAIASHFNSVLAGLNQNILERLGLAFISGKMIAEKFVTGQGLNSFIAVSPKFITGLFNGWLLQPVHNIFLLSFAETGIIGMLLIYYLFYRLVTLNFEMRNIGLLLCLPFILLTGFTDHYWLTLQQNMLIFAIVVGLSFKKAELFKPN